MNYFNNKSTSPSGFVLFDFRYLIYSLRFLAFFTEFQVVQRQLVEGFPVFDGADVAAFVDDFQFHVLRFFYDGLGTGNEAVVFFAGNKENFLTQHIQLL